MNQILTKKRILIIIIGLFGILLVALLCTHIIKEDRRNAYLNSGVEWTVDENGVYYINMEEFGTYEEGN